MGAPVELVLYAEPGGELGARCAEFWAAMSAADAATDAQAYPPHVTLTGFFRRQPSRLPAIVDAFAGALDAAAPAGLDGLRWVVPAALELQVNDDWIGFHVTAAWMDRLVAAFCTPGSAAQPAGAGDDELRPKSWLHLSLAYGAGYDESTRAAAVEHIVALEGLTAATEWTVSLWHRRAPGWERLAAVDVGRSALSPPDAPMRT
jgi:hypothetical protein